MKKIKKTDRPNKKPIKSPTIEEQARVNSSQSLRKWRVSLQEEGMSLLAFLREKNSDAPSVKSLKRAIDGKRCTVNGRTETFSSHPLKKNDVITLNFAEFKKSSLTILYEDQDLIIVDKP